ncbi:ExeA family protein [Nitrincola iocasae]|uniref:AAA family ATPase n=1 Tax=Nitrincola iocasae TaxID=2614693 RepID=A0A5J6LB61_9GAMM|nr:AAA family ATPase [Nitrincola iocasae]QEW05626.1 AAA family ATPase [Nitrincola iocasae]
MLKLKSLLGRLGKKQAELARNVDLSQASIAQIINHDIWPASLNQEDIKAGIREFLLTAGATENDLKDAFELAGAATNSPTPDKTSIEDDIMLLRKQQLTPAARRAFNLVRDPFEDVRQSDDVFMTPDSRYVRESLRMAAKHGGFIAVVGESGAGKSTLRRDLIDWINRDHQSVIVIEPYVLGMEDNDIKGKTLKASHIAEAIMAEVAPGVLPKRSPEARFRQVHHALRESQRAGNRHLLIIEEAHGIPIPTLKHLKRFFELEDGFQKLLGIVLIGQTELAEKLDERNPTVREVVQRCEVVTLRPLDLELEGYLQHRFKMADKVLADVMDNNAIEALRAKLTGRGSFSVLYPLAIHNVLTAALNEAAAIGIPRVTSDLISEV